MREKEGALNRAQIELDEITEKLEAKLEEARENGRREVLRRTQVEGRAARAEHISWAGALALAVSLCLGLQFSMWLGAEPSCDAEG